MADEELVAYVCPKCRNIRPAHWTPSACFRCGSRFDLGAPIALVSLDFDVAAEGASLRLVSEYVVRYLGEWDADARAFVEAVFQHAEPAAKSQTTEIQAIKPTNRGS
jgi:hypothetical protein